MSALRSPAYHTRNAINDPTLAAELSQRSDSTLLAEQVSVDASYARMTARKDPSIQAVCDYADHAMAFLVSWWLTFS